MPVESAGRRAVRLTSLADKLGVTSHSMVVLVHAVGQLRYQRFLAHLALGGHLRQAELSQEHLAKAEVTLRSQKLGVVAAERGQAP